MNMRNSALQALLTRIRLINEMRIDIASHQYFQCFMEHAEVLFILTAYWKVTSMIFFSVIERSIYPNRTVTDRLSCSDYR